MESLSAFASRIHINYHAPPGKQRTGKAINLNKASRDTTDLQKERKKRERAKRKGCILCAA